MGGQQRRSMLRGRLLVVIAAPLILAAGVWVFLNPEVLVSKALSLPYVWFGPHREFFSACRRIPIGAPLEQARTVMSAYLEVGRTWLPPSTAPLDLFDANVLELSETPREHRNRVVLFHFRSLSSRPR